MRIWIVNHYACSPSDAGGTRHFSLARALLARGHDVLIFASSFDHYTYRQRRGSIKTWSKESIDGVPFVWVRSPEYRGNGSRRVWNMISFAARALRVPDRVAGPGPDVVIGSSPHLFAAYTALRFAVRHRTPFVLEVRDLWPESLVALRVLGRDHLFVRLLEVLERRLYQKAAIILSLLPAAADHLVAKGADPKVIRWLPNGVDLAMVPQPGQPTRNNKVIAMYAGAHGAANMLDLVLDAGRLIQKEEWAANVEIHLVGDGPEKSRLMARAKAEGIKMIEFLDAVPKADIYRLLGRADFCLFLLGDSPLWQWGISPNKLFDYMAMARPVILSVNAPLNPVSIARAGITIPPEDAGSLAQAIRALVFTTASERRQMGMRGKRYVSEAHSLTHLAQKLESILLELVAEGPRATSSNRG